MELPEFFNFQEAEADQSDDDEDTMLLKQKIKAGQSGFLRAFVSGRIIAKRNSTLFCDLDTCSHTKEILVH